MTALKGPNKLTRNDSSILYLSDTETFASLILVDHAWREASQTPHLYAYQLSRCPSYSLNYNPADAGPFTDDSLWELKRKFAREVKRNLFEAYMQPKRTVVNLVSSTTSSSAAFPGGEAFDFSFSPNGHWTLALSSSRIYVLDTASPKISVQRELKVLRRPVAAAILDDASKLFVLSSDHQCNVYALGPTKTEHIRAVSLDNPPHAIALTSKGEVLAAAFPGGVELLSLASNASEADRRTIRCDKVDVLSFSSDGTILLGTTRNHKSPSTVILTAPYYTEDVQDLPVSDQISHIWTSQIIFPNNSRDCSNAALLPNRSDGDANWTFTFDRVFESFRAVRTDDLRNGTTYFTGPRRSRRSDSTQPKKRLTPSTLPAPSHCGDLVAAGFMGKDIWLYGVPEGLDIPSVIQGEDSHNQSSGHSTPASAPRSPAPSFTRGEASEVAALPKWQVLVDKYRNVFAKGRRIAEISGASSLCWVDQRQTCHSESLKERLIIAAPGGVPADHELELDGLASVDGGRLVVLDFDRLAEDGGAEEVTFKVGDAEPEMLVEERVDIDTEVELVRRRTRKDPRPVSTVVDALASPGNIPPLPPTANAIANLNAGGRETLPSQATAGASQQSLPTSESPGLSVEEASQFFDRPYSHSQPRSRMSLYRSATAVAANRERNPPRIVDEARVEYRRADGRGELPHESDADNWVPPPPPYAPKADAPLPEHLRRSLMPRATDPIARPRKTREFRPRRSSTMHVNHLSRHSSTPDVRTSTFSRQHYSQTAMSARSVSESLDQLSGPVSPISTQGFNFGDEISEPSISGRDASATSRRRPVSAYVGRIASSLRRPSNPRIPTLNSADVPPIPKRPGHGQSVSLPPSPTRDQTPVSPVMADGNDSQHSLDYSAPPAPLDSSRNRHSDLPAVPAMPSAQQMANLNNRYRQAPQFPSSRRLPPGFVTSGDRIPAPPMGALGAAGRLTSPALHAPARTMSRRNSLAQSSPALLRPAPRRLDTIESVESSVSRGISRSRSRHLQSAGSATARRTNSVGPALRLDRVASGTGEGRKKGWLSGRKGKKAKIKSLDNAGTLVEADVYEDSEKGHKSGKCHVM